MTIQRLDGPRLPARQGPAQQLVVLLHGYGSDGNDLIELAKHWHGLLPRADFVAPHAPGLIPGMEAMAGGRQWFGLNDYDPSLLRRDPHHAARIYEKLLAGAEQASPSLDAFLDAELARLKLPPAKLALVGFSQGTMMALHVGLRRRHGSLGAILGYSGALVGAAKLKDQASPPSPPILLIHGTEDDVVPMDALFDSVNGLGEAGIPARWHLCPGLPHSIDQEGLLLGGHFLARTL
ncbi:dienelactone hydrolase family protein [Ferrovibrio sp.]|uniref:alpha/beta hydrolase n=1 Tax=Ferrovibrio sp. TaxID=1917215 RepID=UPI0025B9F56D|nr:dienelactone hydrolase family protein [Ferrovibrio sp.]